jgi:hypothetical protein
LVANDKISNSVLKIIFNFGLFPYNLDQN